MDVGNIKIFLIFALTIINCNAKSENTYLKYSPIRSRTLLSVNSVMVGDSPSSIGLSFFMKKYHYMYKITNIINNKFYIGIHATDDLGDGYFGSGYYLKLAIKKYGKINFIKEIMEYFTSYDKLNKREREIVNIDFVKRRDTYNNEIGGAGGKYWTDELRKKMSEVKRGCESTWKKSGKTTHSIKTRKIMSENHADFSGNKNPMYGKNVKDYMPPAEYENMCLNISKGNKDKVRTKEHKKNYSNYAKNRIWLVNKKGIVKHGIINDERLKTGKWKMGRKWK